MNDLEIQTIRGDPFLIDAISGWYKKEWGLERKSTMHLLDDFQIVAMLEDHPVGTAGLYHEVSLLSQHPEYSAFHPWLGMLYVVPGKRKLGIGTQLCSSIEDEARRCGNESIYLYTFTAEAMYRTLGWDEIKRLSYKGHDTVIMGKSLSPLR
jgi:GNAT superfamily N-acetyltransferase